MIAEIYSATADKNSMASATFNPDTAKERRVSINQPESWWPWLISLIKTEQASNLKAEEKKPVPQQIETNGETLLEILNFILREVLILDNRRDQLKLLRHYLAAIAREAHQATSHLVYSIELDEDKGLQLIDQIYQDNGNISKVCQAAIRQAKTDVEKARYELELDQIERLLTALNQLAVQGKSPFVFSKSVADMASEKIKQTFGQLGWKKTDELITPELAQQLELETPFVDCWAGQKNIYIMPQSEIHPGGYSVVVLTQPVFIPKQNRSVLLHAQYMIKMSWLDHLKLSQKITGQAPGSLSQTNQELEQAIMSQLIKLDPSWQTVPATKTFLDLLGEFETREKRQQLEIRTKLDQLNLKNYAQYILKILAIEEAQQTLTSAQIKQISVALKRVVLSGLFDLNPMTDQQLTEVVRHYQQFKKTPNHKNKSGESGKLENLFVSSLLSIGYQSAGKSFDLSLVECLTMSPFSALTPTQAGLQPGSASINGLPQPKQTESCLRCPRCGQLSTNSLICSHCGYQRGAPLNPTQTQEKELAQSPAANSASEAADTQPNQTLSIGLAQFVSGYDTNLAATHSSHSA